jgi:3-phosphoshikimate 1-carboxyvinyltransferase
VSREFWQVEPAGSLRGELPVNGDKSVSHRALMVGAVCDGPVRVRGFGASADTRATLAAVRALGVEVEEAGRGDLVVHGRGLRGLAEPDAVIDVMNAGTLLRLLPGLLVGQPGGRFTLDGDASIRRRPVERVAAPLRDMGADVETADGLPPLRVRGVERLRGIEYQLPVASAQVKSCLLLAGLYGDGPTTVIEPRPSRDHTERLLAAAGAKIDRRGGRVVVHPAERLALREIEVPGDFSSAAPFVVAATLLPESLLVVRNVGVNPGRTGLLTALERMGARIGLVNRRTTAAGEPVADLEIRHAELVATEVEPELVPSMVDELPLLALAAACARGRTVVRGAEELKVKESNRLETTADALFACGAHLEATDDGWRIRGVPARLRGGTVNPHGDHRIAMLGAVAGLYSENGVRVTDPGAIDVSFPEFRDLVAALREVPE